MNAGEMPRSSFCGGLTAAALASAGLPAAAQTAPIRFGAAGAESFDESFYLVDAEFLQRAGMGGSVTILPNGPRIMDAVIGRSMDIGMSDILQLANAVKRGLSLAFFAGGCIYDTNAPTTLLCVAKNGPISKATDLAGKTVSVQGLKTLAEVSTREWLRQRGVDPTKVNFVELGPAVAVPTLVRGTTDAAIVSEPFLTSGADQFRVLGKPYDAIAKRFYISAWYATQEWLSANSAMAAKLPAIIYDAARWSAKNRDDSAAILAKRLSIEPQLLKRMTRATFATTLETDYMQPVLDIAFKYGLLSSQTNAATLIARV